jgi:hypothetical protein
VSHILTHSRRLVCPGAPRRIAQVAIAALLFAQPLEQAVAQGPPVKDTVSRQLLVPVKVTVSRDAARSPFELPFATTLLRLTQPVQGSADSRSAT